MTGPTPAEQHAASQRALLVSILKTLTLSRFIRDRDAARYGFTSTHGPR